MVCLGFIEVVDEDGGEGEFELGLFGWGMR